MNNIVGKLPRISFDCGRATGVKGVIADARSYETARQSRWKERVRIARRSLLGIPASSYDQDTVENSMGDEDEERFLQEWCESRRGELEVKSASRNGGAMKQTVPSARMFGRLDQVDALGYLDAIEKVQLETVVVVFIHDHECPVSLAVESAMHPLITKYDAIHFVKVHYRDIEFDNAGVPAMLAYRNQGDLFANMTGIVEMLSDEEDFDSNSLERLLQEHMII